MARKTSMVGKIAPAIWKPKEYVGKLNDTTSRVAMGTLIGICTDTFERTMPDQSTYKGLKGTFEYTPLDDEKPIYQSGSLYLPSGFQSMIEEVIEATNDKGERLNANMSFAFEIAIIRAGNPQGYSWELTPLAEPGEADPLKELRALTNKPAVAQIAAPKSDDKAKGKAA